MTIPLITIGAVSAQRLELNVVYETDCNDFTGWTVSGATIDNTTGNPAPSFNVFGGTGGSNTRFVYREITELPSLINGIIRFDALIPAGGLGNFFFGCEANGVGDCFRIEARTGQSSGTFTTTGWANFLGTNTATADPITDGLWHSYEIRISQGNIADILVDGTEVISNVHVDLNGRYIGMQGDFVSGARFFDNIQILGV